MRGAVKRTMKMKLISICIAASLFATAGALADEDKGLGRSTPDWYTPELHRQVQSAGPQGVPIPSGVEFNFVGFTGIRPGAWMISPNWCTMNFVFNATGTLGSGPYYIGTAKHCVQEQDGSLQTDPAENVIGKEVVLVVAMAPGEVARVMRVGTVSHATAGNGSIGNDFALVQIDSALEPYISPSTAIIGGPTSVFSGKTLEPVKMVGHGLVVGTGGNARAGVISAYNESIRKGYGYGMVTPVVNGDSGAPVITASGGAVGNATQIAYNANFFPGISYGTRVTMVESTWGLKVVTCASATPWPLRGCPTL